MEEQKVLFSGFTDPSEAEMEVADILLHLPHMIFQFESPLPISPSLQWQRKRKRSAAASTKSNSASTLHALLRLGLPPSWCALLQRSRSTSVSLQPKAVLPPPPPPAVNAVKVETSSSPDTPLFLEASESEENLHDHVETEVLGKRKRDEWIKIIHALSEDNKLLQLELQKVELHYTNLHNVNLELKAKREELMRLSQKQEEESRLNNIPVVCQPPVQPTVTVASSSPPPTPIPAANHRQHHEQILMPYQLQLQRIIDQTAQTRKREMCEWYGYQSRSSQVPSVSGFTMTKFHNNNNVNVSQRAMPLKSYHPRSDLLSVHSINPADAKKNRLERLQICRGKRPRYNAR